MSTYDIAVIGGGLIGSAAARHLAEAGHRVAVVAAPEPTDWRAGVGPFASHYDAGRITRITASDPVWAVLAARSIGRYADIATRSGIGFHDPRGLAWLGHDVERVIDLAVSHGADCRMVDAEWLRSTTGIAVPDGLGLEVAYEGAPAGVVNPRALAAAELALAAAAGATVIAEPAVAVSSGSPLSVQTTSTSITASRMLLATGAYGADLVGVELDLVRWLRTTVRIDLGPAPEMPSLIQSPVDHDDIVDMYWNPPVRYPDGRTLFKIGCEVADAARPDGATDIDRWFAGDGDEREAQALLEIAAARLPDAEFANHEAVPCVITRTASGYPYVGWVDDGIAVAIGGNGSSAKSCDEIGRLASTLFAEAGWTDDELPAELFSPG